MRERNGPRPPERKREASVARAETDVGGEAAVGVL